MKFDGLMECMRSVESPRYFVCILSGVIPGDGPLEEINVEIGPSNPIDAKHPISQEILGV